MEKKWASIYIWRGVMVGRIVKEESKKYYVEFHPNEREENLTIITPKSIDPQLVNVFERLSDAIKDADSYSNKVREPRPLWDMLSHALICYRDEMTPKEISELKKMLRDRGEELPVNIIIMGEDYSYQWDEIVVEKQELKESIDILISKGIEL